MLNYLFDYFSAPDYLNTIFTRLVLSFFTALIITLSFVDRMIAFLHRKEGEGQPIREDGPKSHLLTKKGTPTMGGLLIVEAVTIAVLICANLQNVFIWLSLAVLLIYGFTGFLDDYVKVTKHTANAMTAKMKLFLQFLTAAAVVSIITYSTPENIRYTLSIPYFEHLAFNIGLFYLPFAMVVIAGASNAVNLTDGLDGLASGLLIMAFGVMCAIAYVCGGELASSFYIIEIPGSAEIAVVCAAVMGSCLGFLWFNASPAKVFMGDTGSLALGALLGTIAVMLKSELTLAIAGGIFVVESISVMIQVFWYKRTGKRFFRMAPIHHHFEQLGWPETRVVNRFWIIGIILSVLGLLTLLSK